MRIKILSVLLLLSMNFGLVACSSGPQATPANGTGTPVKQHAMELQASKNEKTTGIKIKVTAGRC